MMVLVSEIIKPPQHNTAQEIGMESPLSPAQKLEKPKSELQ